MPIWIIYWDSKCKNTLKTKHLCKVGFIMLCYDPTKRPQSTSIELTFYVSKNVHMEKDTFLLLPEVVAVHQDQSDMTEARAVPQNHQSPTLSTLM